MGSGGGGINGRWGRHLESEFDRALYRRGLWDENGWIGWQIDEKMKVETRKKERRKGKGGRDSR